MYAQATVFPTLKENQIVLRFSTSAVKTIMPRGNLHLALFTTELFRPALGKWILVFQVS